MQCILNSTLRDFINKKKQNKTNKQPNKQANKGRKKERQTDRQNENMKDKNEGRNNEWVDGIEKGRKEVNKTTQYMPISGSMY